MDWSWVGRARSRWWVGRAWFGSCGLFVLRVCELEWVYMCLCVHECYTHRGVFASRRSGAASYLGAASLLFMQSNHMESALCALEAAPRLVFGRCRRRGNLGVPASRVMGAASYLGAPSVLFIQSNRAGRAWLRRCAWFLGGGGTTVSFA